jgi:hypothetical protein
MTCRYTEHAIICSQKDIYRRLLGIGPVESVNGTTDPLPGAGLTIPQDQQNCLRFQTYAVLALAVKWAVQATDIKVDA